MFLLILFALKLRTLFLPGDTDTVLSGRVSYMNLVYGPARHESFVVQWLEDRVQRKSFLQLAIRAS